MKRIKTLAVCVLCIVCTLYTENIWASANFEGSLYALSAVLMDGDSGRVLYEKEGNVIRPMASTTKIMTCIIALEYGDLDKVVKVSKYAASMPDVQLNIKEGQLFVLKDLLYSLMLESHNDTAVAIAEAVAGSVSEFALLMNNKAKEIGCSDTLFITPNGLDASKEEGRDIKVHSTTAIDLAKIMKYCIDNETYINITQTLEYTFTDMKINESGELVRGSANYKVSNKNSLLKTMEGIISGKTGFTSDAGYCYVCAYENDGRRYIVVLLGCGWPNNKNYKWIDTKKLLKYGCDNYRLNTFLYKDIVLPKVKVIDGIYGGYYDFGINGMIDKENIYINAFVQDGEIKMLLKCDESINMDIHILESVEAPINKGQLIGEVRYYIGEDYEKIINIYSSEKIEKRDYLWCFGVIFKRFVL